MRIARVTNGVVSNIEIADEEWFEQNKNAQDGTVLVVCPEGISFDIGAKWDEENGFEGAFTPEPFTGEDSPEFLDALDKEIGSILSGDDGVSE